VRIAFIAAECEPWAKTGGLADVVDALARALGRLPDGPTLPVEVFLPRYRSVPVPPDSPSRAVEVTDPASPSGRTVVRLVEVAANGYRLRLVDHPPAFDRPGIYGDGPTDYPDSGWRFGLLCRTALTVLAAERPPVDVLHLHDWHACPVALLRETAFAADPTIARAAVVLTLHNLAYHGWLPAADLGQLGLAPGDGVVAADATGLDLLRAGVERAEMVTTVSPTYAREALTPEFGFGLEDALGALGDRFVGILNGLDPEVWNPATDPTIAARYSASDLEGKATCRRALLAELGLDPTDSGPVAAMIGRLDPQKGFDLLTGAAPAILAAGGRLVVLGTGNPKLVAGLRRLARRRPGRIALVERFDRDLARRIYAGSDVFLMPSRFEPCGQGQMIALRYGTPPIVRRTGGLADTVVDVTIDPERGTGFVFEAATPDALAAACRRAFEVRGDGRSAAWLGLVRRGMVVDFAWERRSAPAYLRVYARAIALRRVGERARAGGAI
jgi:starch synthase